MHTGIILKSLFLNLTGMYYSFTNNSAAFSRRSATEFIEGERGNLTLDIDTIKQGTRYLVEITDYLTRRTTTLFGRVIIIAARTRVHAGHKHKRTGIGDTVLGTRDIDNPILQGLTKDFQRTSLKFRQLIAKKHSVMSQTYLPWLWI